MGGVPVARLGSVPWSALPDVDQEGNLYIAEVFNDECRSFVPKPGADPAK
jgi:hypothetical protein